MIPKEIYGQFAEHLGTCIYGGLWVGPESEIPNIDGYRLDVFQALKELKIPVLRWPGGCFADEYHWMDGIGPREDRPKMVNTNWGGTVEDNSFGTHEFLNLCEMLGCEPYISGNVGSGSVEELAKWVEYMTCDGESPMARLRRENGRSQAWKVKYLGVGNESWGCGGSMYPEYYADLYRRYSTYCRDFTGNHLYKVASGASDYDYNWTKVLMERAQWNMHGLSLHYYTVANWDAKGSATDFTAEEYYNCLGKCREVEFVIQKHMAIMDDYDPEGRVALLLDEWGTWWDETPGTIGGHLSMQDSMRDALVASLSFDIFHKYTRRLKMANIAQVVNVLQAMVQTSGDKMFLTPTYHVFKMYSVQQDATFLPLDITCESLILTNAPNVHEKCEIPMVSGTASKDANGVLHISLSNVDLENSQEVTISLQGVEATKAVGTILTCADITDHNTFENPSKVAPVALKDISIKNNLLKITLPTKSIVTLELQ